jgi:myo-inositol 2-dehydrogenase/D-chiro-inositol 1-dehydrogenase
MSATHPLAFALFGCGRIGRMHGRNIARNSRARLAACHDVNGHAAIELGAELGCRVAKTADEALGDASIDAVFIASTTDTHAELIERSVKAGKAVLCEKPIDLDLGRVDALWRTIAPLDPLLMIAFNRRFDPSFAALKARIDSGEIGKVEIVVMTSRDPALPPPGFITGSGGLFRDFMIHDFDMARHLVGDIAEVTAVGANLIDPSIGEAGDIDTAMAVLRAASGALVHVNASRRCVYGYDQRLEVFGEKGMLQAGNLRPTTVESWGAGGTHAADRVLGGFMQRYDAAYKAELDHFVDCVVKGTKPSSDFAAGREALRIADAAAHSMATGRAVRPG